MELRKTPNTSPFYLGKNTLILNRASTGIYLSLLAFSNSGKILMPANNCYSPIRVSKEAVTLLASIMRRTFHTTAISYTSLFNLVPLLTYRRKLQIQKE